MRNVIANPHRVALCAIAIVGTILDPQLAAAQSCSSDDCISTGPGDSDGSSFDWGWSFEPVGGYSGGYSPGGMSIGPSSVEPGRWTPGPPPQWTHDPPKNWTPADAVAYAPATGFGGSSASPPVSEMQSIMGAVSRTLTSTPFSRPLATSVMEANSSDPVRDGELVVQDVDVRLPGHNLDFDFRRTYRSRVHHLSPLGWGWDHNFNRKIVSTNRCGDIAVTTGDSGRVAFTVKFADSAYITYQPADPVPLTLIKVLNGGDGSKDVWKMRDGLGRTYIFDNRGLLSSVSDNAGNTLLVEWELAPQAKAKDSYKNVTFDTPFYFRFPDADKRDQEPLWAQITDDGVDVYWRVSKVTDTVGRDIQFIYDHAFLKCLSLTSDCTAPLASYEVEVAPQGKFWDVPIPDIWPGQIVGYDFDPPKFYALQHYGELKSVQTATTKRNYKYDETDAAQLYLADDQADAFCKNACGPASDCHATAVCEILPGEAECESKLSTALAGKQVGEVVEACISSMMSVGGCGAMTAKTAGYHYPQVYAPFCGTGQSVSHSCTQSCVATIGASGIWTPGLTKGWSDGQIVDHIGQFCGEYCVDQSLCANNGGSIPGICQTLIKRSIPFCGLTGDCYGKCRSRYQYKDKSGASAYAYGGVKDLRHNLNAIIDAQGRTIQTNQYGQNPTDPAFDKVVTQQLGSSTDKIVFYYYDYKKDRWTSDQPSSFLHFLQWVGTVRPAVLDAGSALLETAVGAPSGGIERIISAANKLVSTTTDPLATFIDPIANFNSVAACPAYCVKKKPSPIIVPIPHIPPPVFVPPSSFPGPVGPGTIVARRATVATSSVAVTDNAATRSDVETYGLVTHAPIRIPPWVLAPPPDAVDLKPGEVCLQWSYSAAWQPGATAVRMPASAVVVADLHGVVRSEYYDQSGRLLREVNHHYSDKQAKETTQYNYDGVSGALQGVQFADGSRACIETDLLGRPVQQTRLPAPGAPGSAQPIAKVMSFGTYAGDPKFQTDLTDVVLDPGSAAPKTMHLDWDSGRLAKVRVQVDSNQADVTEYAYAPPQPGLLHHKWRLGYQTWAPTRITRPDGTIVHLDNYGATGPGRVSIATTAGEWFTNEISYDDNGRPAEMHRQNHVGGVETQYDIAGRLLLRGEKNPSGNWITTSYGYDGVDEAPTKIDGPTSTKTLAYDALGHLRWMVEVSKLKDVPGRATCMSYSADGRLDSVLRPEGNLINYYYDDAGRLTRKEGGYPATLPAWTGPCIDELSKAGLPAPNAAGHTPDLQTIQVIHYDATGHADQIVDGSGLGVQIVNDGLGRPIDVIDGAGNHHRRGYDARGRVVWEATFGANAPTYGKPQGPAANLHTMVEYQYDNLDHVVEIDRWHFANGQWVNSAHSKATTTIVYDDAHATVSVSQDGEPPTITQLDALGRPVVRTLPNQSVEKFGYAENGTKGERVARSFTGSDGKLKRDVSYYDDYGHLLEVNDDTGTPLVVNALDDLNRLYSRSAGKVVAQYDFDGLGRVASFHEGTGSTARELLYSWDGNDRLKSVRDANKAVTAYVYNGLDLKMSAQHPANGTSTWHYVPGSTRLNDYTDPFGTTEVFAYDQVGRVYSEHRTNAALLFGDGIDRIFTYTPTGLLETATVEGNTKNPSDGSIVSFKYDSLGNRVYEDSSLSSLTIGQVFGPHSGPTQTWLYPRGTSSPFATISRAFDPLGRLQQISVNQTQVATFEHEAGAGRVDYGKQGIASIPTFDHRNRLVGVDVFQGGTALAQVHDAVGIDGIVRERQRQFGASAPMTDFFAVDDAGRVTDENNAMPGFAMMALPAGDVTDKTVRPYFDDPGLRGTTFRSYALDGLGNWLSRTDSQGTTNTQFTPAAGLDQYYSDPTGETWAYQAGTATQAGSNTFTLDVLGQLNEGSSPTDTLHFTYDALGRRVAEQSTSSGANELVWNGNEVIALGPGTTAQRHVLRVVGDGQDQTIALIQALGTGAVTYVHPGSDGSTLAATTDAGFVEGYAYTAFGETSFFEGSRRIGGSVIGNRFLFQGQLYDPSLGTYAMRAREYLPRAGRFISPDPLGIGGGENVYAFCLGKPLFLSDPFGLSPIASSAGFLGQQGIFDMVGPIGAGPLSRGTMALSRAAFDIDAPVWRRAAAGAALPFVAVGGVIEEGGRELANGFITNMNSAIEGVDRFRASSGWIARVDAAGQTASGVGNAFLIAATVAQLSGGGPEVIGPPVEQRGVFFFGDNVLPYIDKADAMLGRPGNATFFMPAEDAAAVKTAADAARFTGMAPSAAKAYANGGNIYGVSFPLDGLEVRPPIAADANAFPHFLEGGHTAVRTPGPDGGYLLNPTREFVTPGGGAMPSGSVLFKLGPNGEWTPIRRF